MKQSVLIASLIASTLMGSTQAGGQEYNLPQQTFSKFISMSQKVSANKQEVKQEVKQEHKQQDYIREFDALVTFYTNGVEDCGKKVGDKDYGITTSGNVARANRTIAMDSSIPFNTIVEIDGLGTFVVQDRGGGVHGNHIDVFVNSASQANKLGVKHLKARIIKWGDGKRVE